MKVKWDKRLGTSKREQGIITPKAPQNRPKAKRYTRTPSRNVSIFGSIFNLFERPVSAHRSKKDVHVRIPGNKVKSSNRGQ